METAYKKVNSNDFNSLFLKTQVIFITFTDEMSVSFKKLILFFLLFCSTMVKSSDTLVAGYELSSPPFFTVESGEYHGPSYWLWEEVAKDNNLHFVYKEFTLDGLLEGLMDGTIDVSASPLTIRSDRLERMDFSPPYYIGHSTMMVRDVSSTEKALRFLKSFFSVNFFRALLALAFVIFSFGPLEWYFEHKHNPKQFSKGLKGLWNGFWWSAVTMTTVGYGDKAPQSVGGRIVAMVWMFTSIMIISGFTASITSSLTIDKIGASNNNIQDFKDKKIGTIEMSATDKWLKNNFFKNKKIYSDMDVLIEDLGKGKVDAVAYDRPILKSVMQKDSLARFRILNIKYNPSFYAMGLNRRLPEKLKQDISVSVLEHTEAKDWKVLLSEFDLE